MLPMRLYTAGIADFERIRQDGRIYVDKTDLIYRMTKESQFVFLSRPRRFGKSLLCSTLKYYFQGRKDLFEGLAIAELEKDWKQHPVLHFDISLCKNQTDAAGIISALEFQLRRYEEIYGRVEEERTPGMRFAGLIQRAHRQTGTKTVVILDEYDAPLLDHLHKPDILGDVRRIMQEFYQVVKACDADEQFVFITGITKFSQLSIFSTLNNLSNISMEPMYASLCGITMDELLTIFDADIQILADECGCSKEAMIDRLKLNYDGYHFSNKSPDVFNPFSLMKAFNELELRNFWFESGTPSYLLRQMHHFRTDITKLDDLHVPASAFDQPTENMRNALPLLYQSGYVTIKNYDRLMQEYTLGIPNKEVRVGFTEGLLPTVTGLEGGDVQMGFAARFWKALRADDTDLALRELQAYLESLPYVEGFKKKLEEVATAEGFYEWSFYLIFTMLNIYVKTQVKCAGGRIDMVVYMPDTVYVMELKVNGTAKSALEQIDNKGYAIAYQTEGRQVVKAGLNFSSETKTLTDWVIA